MIDDTARIHADVARAFARDEAVRQDEPGGLLDVIRQHVIPASLQREGLGEALDIQTAARAGAVFEGIVFARGMDDVHEVAEQGIFHPDGAGLLLELEQGIAIHDGFHRFEGIVFLLGAEHLHLGLAFHVADAQADHEAIHLGEGKRVGAFQFHGVLRGHHKEGTSERMHLAIDGDGVFFHGFQQAGLRAWCGAVDLITEQDVREDGAGAEGELMRLLRIDGHTADVRREEIGGELDAFEISGDGARDGLREQGLADAGDVFKQDVAASDQGQDGVRNGLFFADEGA